MVKRRKQTTKKKRNRKGFCEKRPSKQRDILYSFFIEFEFSLNRFGGCRRFRVSAYPLARQADGRTV
jgi:hypothetical protein